jgi:hypothetical protein
MRTETTVYLDKTESIRSFVHVSDSNRNADTVSIHIGDSVTFYFSFDDGWDANRMRFGQFADAIIHTVEHAFEKRQEKIEALEAKEEEEENV